jgi:lycopene cyclase domain-containing protein
MKWTYLLVNFFTVIVPFIFSFHPRIKFHQKFTGFFKANLIVSVLFLIWDAYFVADGVWSFNPDYILGYKVYNLPLEEILFFVCIPFACLFTFHCFLIFKSITWNKKFEDCFILTLSSVLLIIGMVFWQKDYTSIVFISTSVLLLIIKFYFKVDWLPQLFSIYPVLLIPFFIVNGILTGTGLEHPVVIYNNSENMGIRLLTIPVEDTVYGFELILLNLFMYHIFLNHQKKKVKSYS